MKKLISISFCILLFVFTAFSQDKLIIKGHIKDKETGAPVPWANIIIQENNTVATSDKNGFYELQLSKIEKVTLKISIIGYQRETRLVSFKNEGVIISDFNLIPMPLPGQTVIVTALRGRERITPVTFSNLENVELEKRYTTQDIPVLLSELPSTTFYSESGNDIGYNYLNIRGFDQRRISVMINGVPQNDPEDHNIYWLDFPDLAANLEDIQVQRGAGSAFYGPASIGGSINLITSNFSNSKGISIFSGAGNYNTAKYSISVSSGLIDNKYSVFGKLSKIKSDGYRDKAWADYNSFFLGAIRYDENLTTQIHVYGGPISDHLAYYGISKEDIKDKEKRKANPIKRDEEIENFTQSHYELLQEWRITEDITLNHTLFFIDGEGFFNYDASWGDTSYFRITYENGFFPKLNPENSLVKAFVHNKQYGWLPRIYWNHGSGELTAGVEFRKHNSLHWGKIEWAQNLSPDFPKDFHYYEYKGGKDVFSVYLHELYRLNPSMNLLMDLQYSYNKYKIYDEKFIGNDFSVPYNFVNPRIGLNYNLNDEFNTYFTISYVSREPRLNNIYDAGAERDGATPQFEMKNDGIYDYSKPLVKPESLLNFDLGFGYRINSFVSTINLYWMEFDNEIVKSGQLDRFGQPITGNADKTRHIGTELTLSYNILENLGISGNMTLSKNTFVKNSTYAKIYDRELKKKILKQVTLDDNEIAGFPDFLANLKLTYKYENFYSALIFQYVGKQFTDNYGNLDIRPVKDNVVDAFNVFNLYLNYKIPGLFGLRSIELQLQALNLLDELYATHGESDEFFPAAERNIFFGVRVNL